MATNQTAGRSLGTGLNGIADYSTQLPFLDFFRSARPWIAQSPDRWDTGEPLRLDAQGWVQSLPAPEDAPLYSQAGTLLVRDIPDAYPSGRYVVFYDGKGTIDYGFDATKVASASQPGRDVLQVDSSGGGGIWLKITATDPDRTGNYIRNIRVYQEADLPLVEMGMTFNPSMTQRIKEFGTLRYMDWMQTNGSNQKQWGDRPTMQDASWASRGAPVELMVALANETGTSPWFTMPHQATDDYMRQFATYVRDNLNPGLKVYVEFSNEVWNWQFPQAHYAQEQARARWGDDPIGGAGWMQWYGMRTAQMSQIWKSVFGNQGDRVVSVLATQTAYLGLENYALDTPAWVAEGNAPASSYVDAYAVTGYFGGALGAPENANQVRSWLADPDGGFGKAFQQLRSGNVLSGDWQDSVAHTIDRFRHHAQVAQRHGLELVAYEGGQHIVGYGGVENDAQLTNFFMALNRHPDMKALYTELLTGWRQAGGNLFTNFYDVGLPSKWGSWGALETLNQTTSPKYSALIDFIQSNNRWWNETSPSKLGLFQRGLETNQSMLGTVHDDVFLGGSGNDVMTGGAGRDRLHGEAGHDQVRGDADADVVAGGDGKDTLLGGAGNDKLIGGAEADRMTGGTGSDRFVYSGFTNIGTNKANALRMSLISRLDAIVDFQFSQGDKFQLDFDHNPDTIDRPKGLFQAGVKTGTTQAAAMAAAFADKDGSTAGAQVLEADEAVFFQWQSRTYLAVNNGNRSLNVADDLAINVTGIQLQTGDTTRGTLAVSDYFA